MQHLCLDHDLNAVVASNFSFDLGFVLKFLFSIVIYISIILKCCYLSEAFIQINL